MTRMKLNQSTLLRPKSKDGTSCPSGSFDTSARLDVQAAMMKNHTWSNAAWRAWDSQYAAAPEEYPIVIAERGEG